jgi:3',5'-cyclic AMP phosphodiesterase CpdA
MATRIAHISDLHFPAKASEQVTALGSSIAEVRPDIIVVTGDLTRSGTQQEFCLAKTFLDSLRARKLVVPGNHDIPVPGIWARIFGPFDRFESYFPGSGVIETPDVLIVAMNTAVGLQPGLDWSLGYVSAKRLDTAASTLAGQRGGRLGIVASHHPYHQHPSDLVRSRTFGGPAAFERLATAGMDLLLHGHLHRTAYRCFATTAGKNACELCASTALSNRERGGPAAYNIIDVENRQPRISVMVWDGRSYNLATAPEIVLTGQ